MDSTNSYEHLNKTVKCEPIDSFISSNLILDVSFCVIFIIETSHWNKIFFTDFTNTLHFKKTMHTYKGNVRCFQKLKSCSWNVDMRWYRNLRSLALQILNYITIYVKNNLINVFHSQLIFTCQWIASEWLTWQRDFRFSQQISAAAILKLVKSRTCSGKMTIRLCSLLTK